MLSSTEAEEFPERTSVVGVAAVCRTATAVDRRRCRHNVHACHLCFVALNRRSISMSHVQLHKVHAPQSIVRLLQLTLRWLTAAAEMIAEGIFDVLETVTTGNGSIRVGCRCSILQLERLVSVASVSLNLCSFIHSLDIHFTFVTTRSAADSSCRYRD